MYISCSYLSFLNYLCSVQDLLKISMKDAEEDDKDFFEAMEEIWQSIPPGSSSMARETRAPHGSIG